MRALFVGFCCLAACCEGGGAFADEGAPPRNEKLDLAVKHLPDQAWLTKAPSWWGDGRALLLYGDRDPGTDPLSFTVRPFAMIVAPEPGDDAEPVTIVANEARLSIIVADYPYPLGHPVTEPRRRVSQLVTAFPSGDVLLRGPNGLTLSAPRLEVDWATKQIRVGTEAVLDLAVSGVTIDPLRTDLGLGLAALAATADPSPPPAAERTSAQTPDEFDLEMLDFRIGKFQSGARDMWAVAADLEVQDGAAEDIERATAKALKLTAKAKELRRQRDELSARLGVADRSAARGQPRPASASASLFGARSPHQIGDAAGAAVADQIAERYRTVIKELKGQLDELRKENAELKVPAPDARTAPATETP